MNHTEQNGLKASAYLLGISVEELINVLHNASQIKEISTTSGFPLSLPTRTSKTQPAPKMDNAEPQGRRVDTPVPQKPSDANANEHQRDRLIRYTSKTENSLLGSPHWEHTEGEWVKWEDYARLKAEVERLTKAGDASIVIGSKMREIIGDTYWSLEFDRVRSDWHHVKKGGQP